jgi:uncharacterized protein (TIGR02147 family)
MVRLHRRTGLKGTLQRIGPVAARILIWQRFWRYSYLPAFIDGISYTICILNRGALACSPPRSMHNETRDMATRRRIESRTEVEVNVFDFLDYRAYLRAYYEACKRRPAGFSFRTFSKRAGLKSPNFFKLVIDGDRNLGKDTVPKFADALGLEGDARAFFEDLVAFEQATDSSEKNRVFERIASSRRFRTARRIDGMFHDYLSHWYHPAIRELVMRSDFSDDPRWLVEMLGSAITPKQAAHSVELLLGLGLVAKNAETGRFELREPTLTTEHEVSALGAANFHKQMMQRAMESIDNVPSALRDLAALTVCVSPKVAAEVKRRIHQFRESITELCDTESEGKVVYQLNVQWFPLTRTDEGQL